jgi:hypothetical protein
VVGNRNFLASSVKHADFLRAGAPLSRSINNFLYLIEGDAGKLSIFLKLDYHASFLL